MLCLVFLPLTFSYAIVRYRLMDVDLIFKRGVTYTLATGALVAIYFGAVAFAGEVVHTRLPAAGGWGLAAAIIVAALVFDPMKRAIQDRVDRVFDRKRLDSRATLVEFARSLNTQTDLRALLGALVDRLPRILQVARVGVFLDDEPAVFAVIGWPPAMEFRLRCRAPQTISTWDFSASMGWAMDRISFSKARRTRPTCPKVSNARFNCWI